MIFYCLLYLLIFINDVPHGYVVKGYEQNRIGSNWIESDTSIEVFEGNMISLDIFDITHVAVNFNQLVSAEHVSGKQYGLCNCLFKKNTRNGNSLLKNKNILLQVTKIEGCL